MQVAYLGNFEPVRDQILQMVARSAGAIQRRRSDGTYASCGVTFLSKKYALTAAHCTAGVPMDSLAINVIQSELSSGTTDFAIWLSSQLSGNWPLFSDLDLSGTQLIQTGSYACKVVKRCAGVLGEGCPAGLDVNIDMALLECPGRTGSANEAYHSPVAMTDPIASDPLDVVWYHEYLNANTTTPTNQYYAHYTALGDPADNYHYTKIHQLLPWLSRSFTNGTLYRVMHILQSSDGSNISVTTNAPACHGMSGSGVYSSGTTWLLGPATNGSPSLVGRLCDDMNAVSQSSVHMAFSHPAAARVFESPIVVADR